MSGIKLDNMPKRANARSLVAAYNKVGGESERERAERFNAWLTEAVQKHDEDGRWTPEVDLKGLNLDDVGRLLIEDRCARGVKYQNVILGREKPTGLALTEAGQPVVSTTFSNITGQLMFSEIRRGFEAEEFVFGPLLPVMRSKIKGTETVPGITPIGEQSQAVNEGQEYPSVGINEEYFTLPQAVKRGMKIEITEETLFFDLTGLIVSRAAEIGRFLGLKREIEVCDIIIGQTNNYIRNGTSTNTFLTAGAYVNNQTSMDLVDWTDIEGAELLLMGILDPTTGYPITRGSRRDLIVMPARKWTAKRIVNATETRSGDITTGSGHQTVAGNPLNGEFSDIRVLSSQLLYERVLDGPESETAKAQAGWFWGDLAETYGWKELWPLEVFQQGPENNLGFERDVVLRYKARYYGVPFVKEPRRMTRNENSAWA